MYRFLCLVLVIAGGPASAQDRIPSHCVALAEAPATVMPAGVRDPIAADAVRIIYLDHAMFLLQTPGGVNAMTDFTGWYGNVDFMPDVVTMNNAHGTHFTAAPDPAIPHVLQGWATDGRPAEHHVDLGEMLVRNVSTDVRSGLGVRSDGNSIFVFEAGGMCIGHLGHLHQEPSPLQYALLGRLDVVMAPVDGGLTLDLPTMIHVMQRIEARVVIPMHWFGRSTLEAFLDGMSEDFVIDRTGVNEVTLTLGTLPDRPTVMVLDPRVLSE